MVSSLSLAYMFLNTLFGALGAFVLKRGTVKYKFWKLIKTWYFWAGVILYLSATLFYIFALRLEDLTVLFPLNSFTYIWVIGLSYFYLKEKISKWSIIAIVGIMIGITLIGIGS